MTPTEALHIIRHPEDYCAASRQEARTIIADGYEKAQEQLQSLRDLLSDACDALDNRGGNSRRFREALAATQPKEGENHG